MSGANASPVGRSHLGMRSAVAGPIARSLKEGRSHQIIKHAGLILLPAMLAPAFLSQQNLPLRFVDVAAKAGVRSKHANGATADKHMPETMAGGVVVFDYNDDGWPDLFFVNGGSYADSGSRPVRGIACTETRGTVSSRTWRSPRASEFPGLEWAGAQRTTTTMDGPICTSPGRRQQAVSQHRQDGFTDVTTSAGTGADLWSTSCAWGDTDNDGDVDLYVARYVDFANDNNKYCTLCEDVRTYCHPNVYRGVPDILYRNNGDGTFTDITSEAGGKTGNGLGWYSAITTTMDGSISLSRTTRRPICCFTTKGRASSRKWGLTGPALP